MGWWRHRGSNRPPPRWRRHPEWLPLGPGRQGHQIPPTEALRFHVALGAFQGPYRDMELRSRPVVRTGLHLVGLGLMATQALGGCASDEDSAGPPTTAAPASTTTTAATPTLPTADTAVLDGYRAFWAAYLHAADPMDPQSPELVATATGAQLEQVQRAFLSRLAGGEEIRGTIETHPHLDGPIQATTATVVDCYADDSHIIDAATGAQKDDAAVVHHQVRADMTLVDGVWRVAGVHHEATGCTPS